MTVTIKTKDIVFYWSFWVLSFIIYATLVKSGLIEQLEGIKDLISSGFQFSLHVTTYWLVVGGLNWLTGDSK